MALFLAARGKCVDCGRPLEPGWHADHRTPWSKGGPTDIANGAALCPDCNRRKGDRMKTTTLRDWQQEALTKYLELNKQNFLAEACPGAGKTTWAVTVANTLRERNQIRRVIVVVPSDSLRTQWSDRTDIHLQPYKSGAIVDDPEYDGIVTTYQALAAGLTSQMIRYAIGDDDRRGTLVILDEIHHAAEESGFGTALSAAFESASRRLLLTGTPWRTDKRESMPWVEFVDGLLKRDYIYSYGDAVRDGVCRRANFPFVEAKVEWSRNGDRQDARVNPNMTLKGVALSDAARTCLHVQNDPDSWLANVITRAHVDLESIRREIPDAAGLIVARDRLHALQICELLRQTTGVIAPVVISGEEGGNAKTARTAIETFRDGTAPWIVAVKMIAEGVDIPRLMVGVYATNVTTSMFFTQVLGRFVRVREDEVAEAHLYPLPTPEVRAIVEDIESSLPQRLEVDERERKSHNAEGGSGGGPGDYAALGSEAQGLTYVHTHDGVVIGADVESTGDLLEQLGIPSHYRAQAAARAQKLGLRIVHSQKADDDVPKHRKKEALRKEVNALAGRVANRCYGDHSAKRVVYRDLWNRYGVSMKTAGSDVLEQAIDHMKDCLSSGHTVARSAS